MKKLDQKYLNECFSYNKDTGLLSWKTRPEHHFKLKRNASVFNSKYPKTIACHKKLSKGWPYRAVKYKGGSMSAHRVIFVMLYGNYDNKEIDHVNGDSADNRLCNLRLASSSENQRNRAIGKNNTSGVLGVSWCKRRKKWCVGIAKSIGARTSTIGRFNDLEFAELVAQEAREKYGYHNNHGRKPQ